MIAFLIDADNLSSPAWAEEGFHILENLHGPIAIRRAYGSVENLKSLSDVLRSRAVRPYANLSLSKNTTDVALAVDAMELACFNPCPTIVAIGSGDLDFLPLAVRLRERGIKVLCVTAEGKMSKDAIAAYDDVIYVVDSKTSPKTKSTASTPVLPKKKTSTAAKKATSKSLPASKKTSPEKKAAASTSAITVDKILAAAPALASFDWIPLGNIANLLHEGKILGKNASSTKLFKKFPNRFELKPEKQPNAVRLIREA